MPAAPFPAYGLERVNRAASQTWYKYLRLMERQFASFAQTLDPGIRRAVRVLYTNGIETCQSCQGNSFNYINLREGKPAGGDGHCYPEPTVEFVGTQAQGFRAVTLALECGLKPRELLRVWSIQDGEPTGPHWALTFVPGPHLFDEPSPKRRRRKRKRSR